MRCFWHLYVHDLVRTVSHPNFNNYVCLAGHLTAEVQGPGGLIVPTYIDQRDNIVSCTFTPTIEGNDVNSHVHSR